MGYIRKTIYTGGTAEVEEYYSNRYGIHDRRAPKVNPTPEKTREAYHRKQKKKLRWYLNENFHDGVDALVTLSWRKGDRKPVTLAEVKEAAAKFVKRLRAEYARLGLELKYIYCVEIGPRGSRHIHIVLSHAGELPMITLARCWDGLVDVKPLYSGEYDDLADYMVKGYAAKTEKTTGQELKRCFECSRNLKKPVIEVERIKEKDIRKDIDPPEGYVLDRSTVQEGVGKITGRPYRFYKLRRTGERRETENCAGANGADRPQREEVCRTGQTARRGEEEVRKRPNTLFGRVKAGVKEWIRKWRR